MIAMRVVCQTLTELLANLESVSSRSVFQQVVYASVGRRPIDSDSKYKAVKFAIVFQASVVIGTEEGGEYILECGEECGFDYWDSSQGREGTNQAEALKKKLTEHCDDAGLRVRPGVVES